MESKEEKKVARLPTEYSPSFTSFQTPQDKIPKIINIEKGKAVLSRLNPTEQMKFIAAAKENELRVKNVETKFRFFKYKVIIGGENSRVLLVESMNEETKQSELVPAAIWKHNK